ncbi:M56 family metallopeptidase [Spirosoma litoris]
MNALDYLLKANLYGLLFAGCYWLLLRRHTFFSLNRAYLLASVILSLVLPLVILPTKTVETLPATMPVGVIALPVSTVIAAPIETGPDWEQVGIWAYALVALVLLIRLAIRVGRLVWLIRRSPRQVHENFILVQPNDPTLPTFSFFQYIILNPVDTRNELILQHELVHVRQYHSADVLGMGLLQAFCWACPTIWLIDRLLRQVHEFLADKPASQPTEYARFLVAYSFGTQLGLSDPDTLTNSFFNPSLLKQRIMMLQQKATTRWALSKYMLVLPLAFGLLAMTTAREEIAAVVGQATDDTITVAGRVTAADGKPLPGAHVILEGTTTGAETNAKGYYTLPNVPKNASLVVSFIGFDSQRVAVKGRNVINVMMARAVVLDKVVVTAYEPSEKAAPPVSSTHSLAGNGEVFTVVEEVPEFPGGMSELGKYLMKNLRYPADARKAHVDGQVFIQFVVTETGDIQQLRILKGIGFGCNEEAVRVVSQMPKWRPGKQNGKPVAVQYNLPIQFTLEKGEDRRTGQVEPMPKTGSGQKTGFVLDKDKNSQFSLDDPTSGSNERYSMRLPDSLRNSGPFITIRGHNSLRGTPLYILDGIEVPTISNLNPEDIESITVLKNPASRVQYGAKAIYGVVQITSKKKSQLRLQFMGDKYIDNQ